MPDVVVEGRTLSLSNLDKVLYPAVGWTKAHVLDYYRRIAPVLLPHLRDRALTLKRYPDGVEGEFFYEKQCPSHRPEWVATTRVWSEGRGGDIEFCVARDLPTLMWAVNLADLEMHTYLSRAGETQRPTMMVFDLDPGEPAGIVECSEVALRLRDALRSLELTSFAKTSGSKGMQVYVPLNTPATFEETKAFARALGGLLEHETPDRVVTTMTKAARTGKVFVDWSQNDDHKTTVSVYSLRAKAEPTVSTPVTWKEVEVAAKRKEALSFRAEETLARVAKLGDLFAPVLTMEQSLPALT